MSNNLYPYFEQILKKVSRTFALNIKVLRGDTYRSVLLAYLICRILDTIEDSPTLSAAQKKELLFAFIPLLRPDDKKRGKDFLSRHACSAQEISADIHEQNLLNEIPAVVAAWHELPTACRESMFSPIKTMAAGMAETLTKYENSHPPQIETVEELLTYCYYVAGTVGQLLTSLFTLKSVDPEVKAALEEKCIDFGQGLQLVNILKDYIDDKNRGWSYLPKELFDKEGVGPGTLISDKYSAERERIFSKLFVLAEAKLQNALDYTCTLPRTHFSHRLFCIIPLLLAKATLVHLKNEVQLPLDKQTHKISRQEVKKILKKSLMITCSNRLLRRNYEAYGERQTA